MVTFRSSFVLITLLCVCATFSLTNGSSCGLDMQSYYITARRHANQSYELCIYSRRDGGDIGRCVGGCKSSYRFMPVMGTSSESLAPAGESCEGQVNCCHHSGYTTLFNVDRTCIMDNNLRVTIGHILSAPTACHCRGCYKDNHSPVLTQDEALTAAQCSATLY